jgi:hypothetical protein
MGVHTLPGLHPGYALTARDWSRQLATYTAATSESRPVTPRIFISYRTADGMDKAAALARDLGETFGDAAVFLDKDDLRGGSAWREEVLRTLGAKPVLLLLLTPQLLGATDAGGKLRIEDPQDPVRRELGAALDVGAEIVPLLCDGCEMPAQISALPPPFDQLGERTWRKLRAYDWKADLQRIVDDLQSMGIRTRPVETSSTGPVWRRRAVLLPVGAAVALAAAGSTWFLMQRRTQREAVQANLSGTWNLTLGSDAPFMVVLQHDGERLSLTSMPVPIHSRADSAAYRKFWMSLTGTELRAVVYRGRGELRADPGVKRNVSLALRILNQGGDTLIDGGKLRASVAANGRQMMGRVWLNSEQAERPVTLQRQS